MGRSKHNAKNQSDLIKYFSKVFPKTGDMKNIPYPGLLNHGFY